MLLYAIMCTCTVHTDYLMRDVSEVHACVILHDHMHMYTLNHMYMSMATSMSISKVSAHNVNLQHFKLRVSNPRTVA